MTDRPSLPPDLYTEEYFLHACEGYEEFAETQGERLSRRLSAALTLAAVTPGMKVLDVGCGRGEILRHCARMPMALITRPWRLTWRAKRWPASARPPAKRGWRRPMRSICRFQTTTLTASSSLNWSSISTP